MPFGKLMEFMIVFVILVAVIFVNALVIVVVNVIYVIVVGGFNTVVEKVCFAWHIATRSNQSEKQSGAYMPSVALHWTTVVR